MPPRTTEVQIHEVLLRIVATPIRVASCIRRTIQRNTMNFRSIGDFGYRGHCERRVIKGNGVDARSLGDFGYSSFAALNRYIGGSAETQLDLVAVYCDHQDFNLVVNVY
jgi:hypothetical protein